MSRLAAQLTPDERRIIREAFQGLEPGDAIRENCIRVYSCALDVREETVRLVAAEEVMYR